MIGYLIVAVGAIYLYQKSETEKNPTNPTASVGQYRPQQPSLKFPWQPIVPARADNQNQPWYGGVRDFMSGPGSTLAKNALESPVGIQAQNTVEGIWQNLASNFGDSAKQNLISPNIPTTSNTDVNDVQGTVFTSMGGL